jgi:CDP-glycerol glycerophosphotransferase (TagB/SpsB family)
MDKKDILKILFKPLTPLNRVIPKRADRILVYSNLGFRDNVRSMYDYLIKNGYNKRYEIICSLDDFEKYSGDCPENVKFVSNRAGLRYFFTSKFMFYSFGKYPIKPSPKQRVVNLWHGMPLKTVGNLEKGCEDNDYMFFTYTIATSEFFGRVMSRCFKCPEENVLLTGQPRCDVLFEGERRAAERLILWLPTYRTSDRLGSANSGFSEGRCFPLIDEDGQLEQLDRLLGEYGFKMVIKPHPLQNVTEDIESLENISLKTQADFDREGIDLYEMFKRSAALITDYSSVYFDYMLLDRPIGFTLDDIECYGRERGFVTDQPLKLMPGAKIRSFRDMCDFVLQVCKGEDSYSDERRRVNKTVNSHQSGGAAKSISDIIGLV